MNKKIPKAELEEALNSLEISEESKKAFASSLKSRNESLLLSRIAQILGSLMILSYFTSASHYQELKEQETHVFIILIPLYVGIFFLMHGTSRIQSIKLQRATVELIMKNKKQANHH
ncbi:MAG: hypothetical protein K9M45_04635 [Kiritimatiellales bacterium]|nr:hypothetical protein [Kiritimatiellales bacterium]